MKIMKIVIPSVRFKISVFGLLWFVVCCNMKRILLLENPSGSVHSLEEASMTIVQFTRQIRKNPCWAFKIKQKNHDCPFDKLQMAQH